MKHPKLRRPYRTATFNMILIALFMLLLVNVSLAQKSSTGAITYPIVDSGQTRCYDDQREISYPDQGDLFYGQDAMYEGRTPSYRDNGDGTISDLVTGLMWQKDPGEKKTYSEAVAGAPSCRTGGYNDWRLPSIKEIYSLIQFSGRDPDPNARDTTTLRPFIDTRYFNFSYGDPSKGDRIIDAQMASSTKYVSTTMHGNETMFGVNFADGRIKGYPTSKPGPQRLGLQGGDEKGFFVFYVRGNSDYGKNRFRDNGDGTITDEATGLTWMQLDSGHLKAGVNMDGRLNWQQALQWAEQLDYAGHDDWRLPNIKEMQSIVDYSRSPDTTRSAAIDPLFRVTPIRDPQGKHDYPFYWSSTTHVRGNGGGETACYVAFGRSQGWMPNRQGGRDLLDVHGAGSQRSDPKSGDPSRFPYGRGPQGDVISILNMVRAVRGGDVSVRTEGPKLESATRSGLLQPPSRTPGFQRPTSPNGTAGQGNGMRPGFISRLDRDGDGRVSSSEFDGPAAAFKQLDVNHDGYLNENEAPQGPPLRMRQPGIRPQMR